MSGASGDIKELHKNALRKRVSQKQVLLKTIAHSVAFPVLSSMGDCRAGLAIT